MSGNKTKIDRIHDLLPKLYKTRVNPNWKAIVAAIGQSDEHLADLITQVHNQMFVATASQPYLDRLGANVGVNRPRFLGMSDEDFRKYIPVVAFQPKQVKHILDMLMDIFFFKEATTAYAQSSTYEPFPLQDGFELTYTIDDTYEENIIFSGAMFSDIGNATVDEVAAVINQTATNSFAIPYDDKLAKRKYLRLFTRTVGSKGSIRITGGRAIYALRPRGYVVGAGSRSDTVWTIVKVGENITFTYSGGTDPNLYSVEVGDTAIINASINTGSFEIIDVDIAAKSFTVRSAFGESGTIDHSLEPNSFVCFYRPYRFTMFALQNRAAAWETSPGTVVIEMPASPPVVRRYLKGSAHLNGLIGSTVSATTDTLTLIDAADWPNAGTFILKTEQRVMSRHLTVDVDEVVAVTAGSAFDHTQRYAYTGKTGNVLTGVTPDLPAEAQLNEMTIATATRDTISNVEISTVNPHGLQLGEHIAARDTVTCDGNGVVLEILDDYTFRTMYGGGATVATGGILSVERVSASYDGALVYLTTAMVDTGILGPHMWDLNATFVLSSYTGKLAAPVYAGDNVRIIELGANNIPDEEGYLIFSYGTNEQEGPVRYLSKAGSNVVRVDPTHVFQYTHVAGAGVTAIRRKGSIVMGGLGEEYSMYITDPTQAREIFKELARKMMAATTYLEFLVKYPTHVYGMLDVYRSGDSSLYPVDQ